MPRKRTLDSDRPTQPIRLYVNTIRLAKILADSREVPIAEYLDWLLRDAVARGEGKEVISLLTNLAKGGAPAPPKKPD